MEINVCIGSACHLKGSYNVIQVFQQLIEESGLHDVLELKATFCMKRCECGGVGVSFNEKEYSIAPGEERALFEGVIVPCVKG